MSLGHSRPEARRFRPGGRPALSPLSPAVRCRIRDGWVQSLSSGSWWPSGCCSAHGSIPPSATTSRTAPTHPHPVGHDPQLRDRHPVRPGQSGFFAFQQVDPVAAGQGQQDIPLVPSPICPALPRVFPESVGRLLFFLCQPAAGELITCPFFISWASGWIGASSKSCRILWCR